MREDDADVFLGDEAVGVEVVSADEREWGLHVEDELDLGLELGVVDLEHGVDELLLVDVAVAVLVQDLEEPLV